MTFGNFFIPSLILSSGVVATISSHSPGVPTYSLSPTNIVFLYFCFLAPDVKLTLLIPLSKCLISARRGSELSQVLFGIISYDCILFFFTIVIIGCYGRKLWKCYGLSYIFNAFPNWFNALTRTSFKSFSMSVIGLKSFESSYCVFKSPTSSDRKFCWMFCLVLRNSFTIKFVFSGSVIFRNDNFLLAIFYFFEHGFEHGLQHAFESDFDLGFEHGFEHGLRLQHLCTSR